VPGVIMALLAEAEHVELVHEHQIVPVGPGFVPVILGRARVDGQPSGAMLPVAWGRSESCTAGDETAEMAAARQADAVGIDIDRAGVEGAVGAVGQASAFRNIRCGRSRVGWRPIEPDEAAGH